MKNGYYIHFDARLSPGVSKKIDMQIREFQKYYIMEEINLRAVECSALRRIGRLLPGGAIDRAYENALEQMQAPAFLYIRRTTADKAYVSFFKNVKHKWPECKIIVEIFTYPYDRDEFLRLMSWPYYFKEKYNRQRLKPYIDRYVTYSQDTCIFGVPTIRTGNGIEVNRVKVPGQGKWNSEELHLIAVAFMQKHHGYERVIKGLHEYYSQGGERKIFLHLVGDGPEKKKYYRMTKKFHLEKQILFYPTTLGEDLDAIYEKGDIAISALGCYKDGVNRENSLKSREYMAKGFPMITGCPVDGIEKDYIYICEFPNNASPITMDAVLQFYDDIIRTYTREEVQQQIRTKVMNLADMPAVMKPIIDYIERV